MFTQSLQVFPLVLLLCCHIVYAQIPSSGCTLKASTPAGKRCGTAGTNPVYAQPGFTRQTLNSVTECQDLCLRRAGTGAASCATFSYDSSSSLCTIASGALQSISANPGSSVVFYERACFSCPDSCSREVVGQTLLDNGGFELSPKYTGGFFSAGIQAIANNGKGSQRSYACTAGKTTKCILRQSFSSCNSSVYRWSYDYKATYKKFDSFYATASYSGGTSHLLRFPNNSPATLQWHTYSDLFAINYDVTDAAFSFNLLPGQSAQGGIRRTFQVDNIKLEPTTYDVHPLPGAYNSLPSGSFEDGTLEPFKKTKPNENVRIVSPGLLKKYACRWTIRNSDANPSFGLYQDLRPLPRPATVPGNAYLFNIDFKNNLPQGMGVRPQLHTKFELFSAPGSPVQLHNVYEEHHSGNLGTIRIPFQGNPHQDFMRFTISVVSSVPKTGNYYITIDSLSFKPLGRK